MTNEELDALQKQLCDHSLTVLQMDVVMEAADDALAALRAENERLATVIRAVRGLYQVTHIHAAIDAAMSKQEKMDDK